MKHHPIEIVPAILRPTFEALERDWDAVREAAHHIQIDVTDGIFAGEGSFRDLRRLKQLTSSDKIELHMMVHTPSNFVDDVIDLNPARCVFHIESFSGTSDVEMVYAKLKSATQAELGLAINPDSPTEWLDEHLDRIQYVLFLGYNPGWANQPINPIVYTKIAQFLGRHEERGMRVAVDGHVDKETAASYVQAGASILCANTSIFGQGNPAENMRQLQLLAEAAQRELHS